MTTLADINELQRSFWKKRRPIIGRLLANRTLVAIVAKREAEKAHFVKLAVDEVTRIERIRNQKSFESELENASEEYAMLPIIEAQRCRARRPRGKITEDGKTLNQVIETLVSSREHLDSSAPELWPHLFDKMNQLLLDPREKSDPTDFRKSAYTYQFNSKTKTITYGRFANLVSKYKNSR